MAFQFFNLSVDAPDTQSDCIPEDITFNDQESFVELIVEKVLGYENAIEEHDDADDDSPELEINKQFKLYTNLLPKINFASSYIDLHHNTPFKEKTLSDFFREINPPPPKA